MIPRPRHGRQIVLYHALELALGAGAYFCAYWLRGVLDPWLPAGRVDLARQVWVLPVFLGIWSVLTWLWDGYRDFRGKRAVAHAAGALATTALALLGVLSIQAVFKLSEVNRSLLGLLGVLHLGSILAARLLGRALLLHYTAQGYDRHFVLVGGTHEEAASLARHLESASGGVVRVKGLLSEGDAPAEVGGRPVLGRLSDAAEVARREVVDAVYFMPRSATLQELREVLLACDEMGVVTHVNLPLFGETNARLEAGDVLGHSFLTFTALPKSAAQLAIKRGIDVAAALVLLLLLSPLLLVTALLVKLTSRGPVLFRQTRIGRNGRPFILGKFRTMRHGAELERSALETRNEIDGPAFKIREDPRVTWLGRILRKTSIDELPQLVNVLKGDMSLVGPRPLPDYEVAKIQPWQRRRMNMRPGITCLWAVSGRSQLKFEDWMRLDLEYIDRWSLWLDVKILLRTVPVVIMGRGAY